MEELRKILDYWNKDGLCSKDSPTSHADPFQTKIDNYFETRQLTEFISKLPAKERALDIGAGYGRFAKVLAGYFKNVVAVEGADRIFTVLEQEMNPFDNVISIRGSFESLADKWENKFDLILASGILYLYNDEMVNSFFEAVKKNLSPNGVLILRDFVVKGERINKKSVYVQNGNCYYRDQIFWNDFTNQYGMKMYKFVKSKPDLRFLRNPIVTKTIKLFHFTEFLLRAITAGFKYNNFIDARESFTKTDCIYTIYMVIKNA